MMWAPFSVLAQRLDGILNPPPANRPSVLVIGSGWGAHAFVGTLDQKRYQARVLSPTGYRLNQPSLIHAFPNFNTVDLRTHFNPSVPQILDSAIELKERSVKGLKDSYHFDYLVIAAGSEAFDFHVKGVRDYCHMCKTDKDLEKIKLAKSAIVLGAGPTGIELACKLKSEGVQVRLLEATPTILPGFSDGMRTAVHTYLSNIELPVTLNSPVQSITKDAIVLKGEQIPYGDATLIWTCGIRPAPFVRRLTGGAPLTVDPFLCYKQNIYALGDCVKGYPPTAQNAKQQGIWLAHHFNSGFASSNNSNNSPYQYHERGRLLDLTYAIFIEYQGIVWHVPYFLTPLVRYALKQ